MTSPPCLPFLSTRHAAQPPRPRGQLCWSKTGVAQTGSLSAVCYSGYSFPLCWGAAETVIMPWLSSRRVVSLPGRTASITSPRSQVVVRSSFSPSILGAQCSVRTVNGRRGWPAPRPSSSRTLDQLVFDHIAWGSMWAYSVSSPAVISLDQRNSLSRELCSRHATSGRWPEAGSSKQPVRVGSSAGTRRRPPVRRVSGARVRNSSSSCRTAGGLA